MAATNTFSLATIKINLFVKHPLLHSFTPRWNIYKADWKSFVSKLQEVSRLDVNPFSIEDESDQLVFFFILAVDHAIPKTKP